MSKFKSGENTVFKDAKAPGVKSTLGLLDRLLVSLWINMGHRKSFSPKKIKKIDNLMSVQ